MIFLQAKENDLALARKKPEADQLTLSEQRAQLVHRLRELDKMERSVLEELLILEKTTAGRAPEPDGRLKVRHAAEALLAGIEILDAPSPPPERTLIVAERLQAVRQAIAIGNKRLQRVMEDEAEEIEQEFLPAWKTNISQVIELVRAMEKLATERRDLLDAWRRRSGVGVQPIGVWAADQIIGLTLTEEPARMHPESAAAELIEAARQAGITR
jgi:hypothetical protein